MYSFEPAVVSANAIDEPMITTGPKAMAIDFRREAVRDDGFESRYPAIAMEIAATEPSSAARDQSSPAQTATPAST